MMVTIRSQEAPNENQVADTHSAGGPSMLTVINEYFEIIAVFLEAGVLLLLWKTVKDFSELAKVSKLQTQVRFRPWVGPTGGFEFLREDTDKKRYSIAMKNLEKCLPNVIVTSSISDTKPDKSAILESSKSNGGQRISYRSIATGNGKEILDLYRE
jgi:hypothetical protein